MDEFADRVLDTFWERPEFQRLRPPREAVRAWVRWNLELVNRWLIESRPPTEGELDVFREHARARAAEGTPADVVPANFRAGARFAWRALLEAATDEERPALLESADLLFEYVDRVSRIYSEAYAEVASQASASAEEAAARRALSRISVDEAPRSEDHRLAERLGFQLDRAARPFVVAAPRRSTEYHAELAAALRRRRALAMSDRGRVIGLSNRRLDWDSLELDRRARSRTGRARIGIERGHALDELRRGRRRRRPRGYGPCRGRRLPRRVAPASLAEGRGPGRAEDVRPARTRARPHARRARRAQLRARAQRGRTTGAPEHAAGPDRSDLGVDGGRSQVVARSLARLACMGHEIE